MAEECNYYYYDCGYCCALKRESEGNSSIDSDIVHRYCWGYHYEECPRYKNRNTSGGCFLTSACVDAQGLSDDCEELTTLRVFRDSYIKSLPQGKYELCKYYHTAPTIVAKIRALPNATEVFNSIYNELVLPCVKLIHAGNNEAAYKKYRDYVKTLQEQYIAV